MTDDLKNKMQQYEEIPPVGNWQKIASILNEQPAMEALSTKMNLYEVAPPPKNLEKIFDTLYFTNSPALIPIKKIGLGKLKFAAAAVLIIMATSGIWYFFQNKSPENKIAVIQQKATNKTELPPETLVTNSTNITTAIGNIAMGANKENEIKNEVLEPATPNAAYRLSKQIAIKIIPVYINETNSDAVHNKAMQHINQYYLHFTNESGTLTNLSSKLGGAFNVLSKNSSTNSEDYTWEKRLADWRKKIISAGFLPSGSNGLDILSLKELIDEFPQQ